MAISGGDVIGNTPLLRLNRVTKGLDATIAVKLEYMNPAGSVKDRIAFSMIEAAEAEGKIVPGKTVLIEPTSGNYGNCSGLLCCSQRVILTDPATAVKGAIERAQDLAKALPNSYIPNQVDIVCFGVGSGGTCTGVGRYLKEQNSKIEVYPVEPFESSAINGLPHSPHKIQGMLWKPNLISKQSTISPIKRGNAKKVPMV
ncbi:hypothetical protein KIN20_003773 [Parelaphostrongylus tenuis]|uniref:Tryptophan synthase beta chain-like PALP domain-containing protein n=1 Tax=Parelaphostrongylus tenuis TaxID=148309 RepID=A0AAD5MG43_PARTN|nr:hypothetical protein KIN20_003773 [Parelaphostrongylus tenuis]